MSVIVYSRLGDLLRVRNMTVGDLRRLIADRFGLHVNARTLDRLTHADRVRRPDLELAAAAAAILDVGLDDVFVVETVPVNDAGPSSVSDSAHDVLSPHENRRLQELFTHQGYRPLTDEEHAEMDALVADYGRRSYAQGVREIAVQRGVPVGQVRDELAAERERILAWKRELEADPVRLQALLEAARDQQRARATG